MTSWETGERIRDIYKKSERRQPFPRNPAKRQRRWEKTAADRRERRQLTQLVVCGTVFVLLVAVKLLLPAKMEWLSERLIGLMSQNIDVAEVFSAVGRGISGETALDGTLSDLYQAVENNQIVFSAF